MKDKKLVIIMVGLPARGKTFLSLRLQRYLEWQGRRVRIFNAGDYRRELLGLGTSRSEFFDPANAEFAREREEVAKRCFADLTRWLASEGDAVIYDATNVSSARREFLKGECVSRGFDYVFVENICNRPEILDKIVRIKLSNSVDYREMDVDAAKEDFWRRISHYESVYETVERDSAYIKVYNFGEKVVTNLEPDGLEDLAGFLGSINLSEKEVYLTRHGETFFNTENRIGGDSSLTEKGVEYARRLSAYFSGKDIVVFTSRKKRTVETASFLDCEIVELEELNEIESGICDSMTYEEIARRHPEIDEARKADKFGFRYPEGESYRDLIQRVKRAVARIEAERRDVLVIAHRAVNRCLFAYFIPTPAEELPYIDMPLNKIIRIHHKRALYGHQFLSI